MFVGMSCKIECPIHRFMIGTLLLIATKIPITELHTVRTVAIFGVKTLPKGKFSYRIPEIIYFQWFFLVKLLFRIPGIPVAEWVWAPACLSTTHLADIHTALGYHHMARTWIWPPQGYLREGSMLPLTEPSWGSIQEGSMFSLSDWNTPKAPNWKELYSPYRALLFWLTTSTLYLLVHEAPGFSNGSKSDWCVSKRCKSCSATG